MQKRQNPNYLFAVAELESPYCILGPERSVSTDPSITAPNKVFTLLLVFAVFQFLLLLSMHEYILKNKLKGSFTNYLLKS